MGAGVRDRCPDIVHALGQGEGAKGQSRRVAHFDGGRRRPGGGSVYTAKALLDAIADAENQEYAGAISFKEARLRVIAACGPSILGREAS